MAQLTYNPRVFETPDIETAKRIILTNEQDLDSKARWAQETPYLAALAANHLALGPGRLLLDYGCGIGRVAKELIERTGCTVLGVDISQRMRAMAPEYVGTPAFSVVTRRVLDAMVQHGLRVDAAICVWVLQHCPKPAEDLGLIKRSLGPEARLLVVNNQYRAIPTVEKPWAEDGLSVANLLDETLKSIAGGKMDPDAVGSFVAEHTFWGIYLASPA